MSHSMRCLVVGLCLAVGVARAEGPTWRVEAPVTVASPGLVEVVVPPGLQAPAKRGLDLRVVGPEGETRSFELAWGDDVRETSVPIQERSVRLLDGNRFYWEGDVKGSFLTRRLRVALSDMDFMGKVRVEGFQGDRWVVLATDEALYREEKGVRAEIQVREGVYRSFRLTFQAFNRDNRRRLVAVSLAEAVGKVPGRDYAKMVVSLGPKATTEGEETVLTGRLPGAPLWVEEMALETQGQFTGDWVLGWEEVVSGVRQRTPLRQERVEGIGKGGNILKVRLEGKVPGRDVVWRLHSRHFLGETRAWTAVVRCPRLVFLADSAGVYRVQAGAGESVEVLESPSDATRSSARALALGPIRSNAQWRPEDLMRKYGLEGGPFDGKGYAWQAPVSVAAPGYQRLVLGEDAGLGGDLVGIRLVKDSKQVPYFWETGEDRRVDVPFQEAYDAAKNQSQWDLALPRGSERWEELVLTSKGVFRRGVVLQKKNAGTGAWEDLTWAEWVNSTPQESEKRFSLSGVHGRDLRLKMGHGDNQPIHLSGVRATYTAPALGFLTNQPGVLSLFGGNPRAAAPRYDLFLVQNELGDQAPLTASCGPLTPFEGRGLKARLYEKFEGSSLGLYLVLGLVTLALLFIVARMFPKSEG